MSIDAYQGPAFNKTVLKRDMLKSCPIEQFGLWYKEAEEKCSGYANPVSLGSVSPDGQPVVRTVLLKGFDRSGFRFYTNYESRKGCHLKTNPKASMCFYWEELERQVIVLGSVAKLSKEDSDQYFATRGHGSQIGAHVSSQSQVINNREELETEMHRLEELYKEKEVPRPENWGGFLLRPGSIEFWQGQPDRLHDRFIYEAALEPHSSEAAGWTISRLAP